MKLFYDAQMLLLEFATDIADVYPEKPVTLIHSRGQLLPRFDKWMHESGLSIRTIRMSCI